MSRLLPGAAFYICMALSGVTCSPPPPSATIEAIEAIEPNDEDREGKSVLLLPPLLNMLSGSPAKFMHTTAHTTIPLLLELMLV